MSRSDESLAEWNYPIGRRVTPLCTVPASLVGSSGRQVSACPRQRPDGPCRRCPLLRPAGIDPFRVTVEDVWLDRRRLPRVVRLERRGGPRPPLSGRRGPNARVGIRRLSVGPSPPGRDRTTHLPQRRLQLVDPGARERPKETRADLQSDVGARAYVRGSTTASAGAGTTLPAGGWAWTT